MEARFPGHDFSRQTVVCLFIPNACDGDQGPYHKAVVWVGVRVVCGQSSVGGFSFVPFPACVYLVVVVPRTSSEAAVLDEARAKRVPVWFDEGILVDATAFKGPVALGFVSKLGHEPLELRFQGNAGSHDPC